MELTDLEICKRIAEIEGVEINHQILQHDNLLVTIPRGDYMRKEYNPLTDDALNHQLMIKYKVTTEFTRYYNHLKSITTKAYYDNKADNGYGAYIQDISPNKAICLAIIEAHNE
jgi:hypothetical protein